MNDKIEYENNDINLKELFSIILWGKYTIISITTLAAILSIFYSLSLPNIYTSKVLLAEANQQNSLSSKLGSMSSLAGIAGISIPQQSSKSVEAIERVKSFDFFSNYFLPNIKLENLLAIDSWNYEENVIIYDGDIYNKETNQWVRKEQPKVPSNQQAYKKYKENFINYKR